MLIDVRYASDGKSSTELYKFGKQYTVKIVNDFNGALMFQKQFTSNKAAIKYMESYIK